MSKGDKPKTPLFVVGIGASAGGLESMRPLLNGIKPNGHIAFVIAQHMSPQHRSLLVELLAKECPLRVIEARNGDELAADTVYVNPPNQDILVIEGKLSLRHLDRDIGPKPSVDTLFTSLAKDYAEHAVGIILSGTGSDGAHGCRAIRAAGGITIAQDPETAKYDGMPTAAIRSESIDLILSPGDIANQLPDIISSPPPKIPMKVAKGKASGEPQALSFEDLIDRIYQKTQVDFRKYKEATLSRQLQRRIAALRLSTLEEYFTYIDSHPDEIEVLQQSFLISVTQFFRDREVFDKLGKVLETLIASKPPRSSIRIWIPGCATGEEVYSIAILLHEQLGNRVADYDIKLFGTDIDGSATEVARKGLYAETSLESVSSTLINRYFTQEGRHYKISKHVRDYCIFARQDLVSDPPFLKMDLISCRNLLIYLNSDLQDQIINNFHYALQPGGYLMLGKSESVGSTGASLFYPIDTKNKIFGRRDDVQTRVIINGFSSSLDMLPVPNLRKPDKKVQLESMHDCLLNAYSPPSVLINKAQEPVQFFGDLSGYLSLPQGAADFNILSLAPPSIRTELLALLYRVSGHNQTHAEHIVDFDRGGEHQRTNIVVRALKSPDQPEPTMLISFEDLEPRTVATLDALDSDSAQLNEIDRLQNELAGTREHLQAVIEELETSNEELQSLNEELQASTEELQSSNEELETTNEELQATNEELTTVNDELQAKSLQLGDLNETLSNIQNSINMGLIVLDDKLRLVRYTPKVVRLFGILPDDIGQNILGIPAHVKVNALERVLMSVIQSGEPQAMEVQRDNYFFVMSVSPYLNDYDKISGVILTFSDITELVQTRNQIQQAERKFRLITESLQEVVWMSAPGFDELHYISPAYQALWGKPCDILYKNPQEYIRSIHPDDRQNFLVAIAEPRWDLNYRVCRDDSSTLWVRDRGAWVHDNELNRDILVGSAIDITASVESSRRLELSEERFRKIFESSSTGMALVDLEGHVLDVNRYVCNWLGYKHDEMLGMHFSQITFQEDLATDMGLFTELIEGKRASYQLEKRYLTKSGDTLHGLLSVSLAYLPHDETQKIAIAVLQDINEQIHARQLIYEKSNFDPLTKLPNRNLLKDRIEQQIKHNQRQDSSLFVLFIDLDGFKEINDSSGHNIGDYVLQETAERLRSCVRSSDTVARFGGDEFVVVLCDGPSAEAVEQISQAILSQLSTPFVTPTSQFTIGASIGISCSPGDSTDFAQLIQYADTAMYMAKRNGGNDHAFFSDEMNTLAQERVTVKRELLHALQHDELFLEFQPIYNPLEQRYSHCEALVRWHHPSRGLLYPGEFIPHAERSSLIEALDIWVFKKAAQLISEGRLLTDNLAINITAKTLGNETFRAEAEHFSEALKHLCFEITERVLLEDKPYQTETLAYLRAAGAKLSIDDFGTGFSNLSRLKSTPIDIIKIDKTFTDQITSLTEPYPIIDAILNIARATEALTIVEGVETQLQYDYFRNRERVMLQGFYHARPMPEAELMRFLKL